MKHLIVVAHPDDEVLALSGSAHYLGGSDKVSTCILSSGARKRSNHPGDNELLQNIKIAHDISDMSSDFLGDFPNLEMNTVPHIALVEFIEKAILDSGATHVYTHHPYDLNDDHKQVSNACQAAVRLFQRKHDVVPLEGFYYVEIPSSTDWSFNTGSSAFTPTGFFEIGEEGVKRKIQALTAYKDILKDFPHPRSKEVLYGLAALRGAQSGLNYAEAVQVVFEKLK